MNLESIFAMLGSYWMVLMVILFFGIVTWAFLPGNKRRFEKDANIIFDDEKKGRDHGAS